MTTHCAHQFLQCISTLYMCYMIANKSGVYDRFLTVAVVDRFSSTFGYCMTHSLKTRMTVTVLGMKV
jgi:hypothetical protein